MWQQAKGGFRVIIVCLMMAPLFAQNVISTFAGSQWRYPLQSLPATSAPLGTVWSLAFATNGDLLVADVQNNIIVRITPAGVASVVAGNGLNGFAADGGPATAASLGSPVGVVADSKGNIYIADAGHSLSKTGGLNPAAIRKIAPDGTMTSLGVGQIVPTGPMAVDSAGNLFVAAGAASGSAGFSQIFRLQTDGTFVAVAGTGASCFGCAAPADGAPGLSANFGVISGIAADQNGNLYLADSFAERIYRLSAGGTLTTLVTGVAALQMACDRSGNLYVPDARLSNSIKKITPSGSITLLTGNGTRTYSGDGGPANAAGVATGEAVAVNASGTVFIGDGPYVRAFQPGGTISVFAGNGKYHFAGDGGLAANAVFYGANALTRDLAGNIYVGGIARIRRISPTGIVTTIAGTGIPGFTGDGGLAVEARIDSVTAMATDLAGNLYFLDAHDGFADTTNQGVGIGYSFGDEVQHLRKVTPGGIITSLTTVLPGYTGSTLNGMTVDPAGIAYVSTACNSVYRIPPSGPANLFAGTPCLGSTPNNANAGYNGDNIPATQAMLNTPAGLASDAAGNIYIADTLNSRVRYVSPAGIIKTVASVALPGILTVTPSGTVFSSTVVSGNKSISMVSNGVAVPFAGSQGLNANASTGDGGPATAASIAPTGMVADSSGNLFVSELNTVREVLANAPAWTVMPTRLSFQATAGSAAPAPQFITLNATAALAWSAATSTMDGTPWLTISSTTGSGTASLQAGVNLKGLVAGTYSGTIVFSSPTVPVKWSVAVSLIVLPSGPPRFFPSNFSAGISFHATQGSSAIQRATAPFANLGGGTIDCTLTAKTYSGGDWLIVPTANISVPAETSLAAMLYANTAGLPTGTYTGSVTVTTSLQNSLTAPVTLTISAGTPVLAVSQTALIFTAVAGAADPPAQSFAVLNYGVGVLSWVAEVQYPYRPQAPVSISSVDGSSGGSGTAAPQILVAPHVSGLAPGNYSADVNLVAAGPNDPAHQQFAMVRSVAVYLTVLPAGSALPPIVRPTGAVFSGAGSANAQQINVSNPGGRALSFSAVSSNPAFTLSSTAGSLAPGQTATITVQSALSSPGSVRGNLTFVFSDGSVKTVALLSVIGNGSSASGLNASVRRFDSTACVPTKLAGVFTSLSNYDFVAPGQINDVRVQIVDDCGNPMNSGYASVEFSDGTAPLLLNRIGSGVWEVSWTVAQSGGVLGLSLQANNLAGIATQSASLNVEVSPTVNVAAPFVYPGGVASAAYATPGTPVAPGGLIAVYGSGLAAGDLVASSVPLPFTLGGVQVLLGSELLPLFYAGAGQIDAVVPWDAPVGATLPLTVTRAGLASPIEPVVIAGSQPAIFPEPGINSTQGAIVGPAGGLVIPQAPVSAGDLIVIYCTGLGLVQPSPATGTAASLDQLSPTVDPVSVTVGGIEARVLFSGLAPGSVGEYQINAVVPAGVSPGDTVPVVLRTGSQTSLSVTIAVR